MMGVFIINIFKRLAMVMRLSVKFIVIVVVSILLIISAIVLFYKPTYAVYLNDEWLHIDLTWDDPVSSDGKDYLFHTYFLVSTEAMKEADQGETVIEEHNFNPLFYLEFN